MTLQGPVLWPFLELRAASLAANHPKIQASARHPHLALCSLPAEKKQKKKLWVFQPASVRTEGDEETRGTGVAVEVECFFSRQGEHVSNSFHTSIFLRFEIRTCLHFFSRSHRRPVSRVVLEEFVVAVTAGHRYQRAM